jgi:predicted RNA polymerase sigma factor
MSWSETGWDTIIGLYDLLGPAGANPVVALNRAVAVTERDGPEHGLAALEAIAGLELSHLWHAAVAGNLRRPGRTAQAAGELETAAWLAPAEGGRRLLVSRLLDVRPEPRLTDSRAAGVLYWFRRSSCHQTQIPISEITLERRSR